MEVGALSRGVMLPWAQPVSAPLQRGIRFFHPPLPALPSASLTVRVPWWEEDGLTTFHTRTIRMG
jgi:hypothetical protein